MALEIERKFLLLDARWRSEISRSEAMRQAYLGGSKCSMRVRIGASGAYLNLKAKRLGVQRLEYEYPIPTEQAIELIEHFAEGAVIIKTRHFVPSADGLVFEIDEFAGDNSGLIVAELELPSADFAFEKPPWLGAEVTEQSRYYNSNLVARPFITWGNAWD